MSGSQVFGGTGGGACPTCSQYGPNCHCVENAQEWVDQVIADSKLPPCRHCGKMRHEHPQVFGVGYVCPQPVFLYKPVMPPGKG